MLFRTACQYYFSLIEERLSYLLRNIRVNENAYVVKTVNFDIKLWKALLKMGLQITPEIPQLPMFPHIFSLPMQPPPRPPPLFFPIY